VKGKIETFFKFIDFISEKIGVSVSLLVLAMMGVTTFEVVARYAFDSPTIWAWPINKQLFGVFILFAGIYTLLNGAHLRVEVLYNRFPPRIKSYVGVIGLLALMIFIGVLIWQGGWMAFNSIMSREFTQGAFKIPLYIFKTFIPIAAFLFLLEGLANFLYGKERSNF